MPKTYGFRLLKQLDGIRFDAKASRGHHSGMADAFSIGVSGMKAAESRFAFHAARLVRASVTPTETVARGVTSSAAMGLDVGPIQGPVGFDTIPQDIVELDLAKFAYRASAMTLRTADQMARTLLDVIS